MKLYTYDPAPSPRRLALFMRHKGIEIQSEQIDMVEAAQLNDAYREIVPTGTLPALVLDDGTVLTEVVGICTYLEALHPEKPLLGTTPLEKALVISWIHRLSSGLSTAIASVLRNRSKAFANRALPGPLDIPQIPDLIERGQLQLRYFLPQLNAYLANHQWLAGKKISQADIDLLVTIDFLSWIKEGIPEDCPHLQAWYDRTNAELA